MTSQTTADVFKLQDGSGEIDARHWVETRSGMDDDQNDENMCVFSYVSNFCETSRLVRS
jgi:hypothetical protein